MAKKAYRIPPPKDPGPLPSEVEVGDLERRLRMAAGSYYDVGQTKPPGRKTWLEKGPPGIVKRFKELGDSLLPAVKYRHKDKKQVT